MREAQCRCGQLTARCSGEPFRVSVCHCLDCQRRSGSAFAAQARWSDDQVTITGPSNTWVSIGDSGNRATFRFCPNCSATISYSTEAWAGVTAIPPGSFADPTFPAPSVSVYEERMHAWTCVLGDGVEHFP